MTRGPGRSQLCKDLVYLFRYGAPSDRASIVRFLDGADQEAFAALIERHGPMVRGVCGRLLASTHDADDAFQATFIILAGEARTIRNADRLGPWLYGVAFPVASKARTPEARRLRRRRDLPDDLPAPAGRPAEVIDFRSVLDSELAGLLAPLRDVLVLCLLEGATADEASRRLGCPLGTVKSRLARGREALRCRLLDRGLAPAPASRGPE